MTSAARHTQLEPVSPDNAVLLLVDQQEGWFSRVHEPGHTRANVIALARSARLLGIPAVRTTALAAGLNGPQLPGLTETFAGQEVIDRTLINAWRDSRVHEAITHTGRNKVIIAGTGLDVCANFLPWPAPPTATTPMSPWTPAGAFAGASVATISRLTPGPASPRWTRGSSSWKRWRTTRIPWPRFLPPGSPGHPSRAIRATAPHSAWHWPLPWPCSATWPRSSPSADPTQRALALG